MLVIGSFADAINALISNSSPYSARAAATSSSASFLSFAVLPPPRSSGKKTLALARSSLLSFLAMLHTSDGMLGIWVHKNDFLGRADFLKEQLSVTLV
ncbi:hypothetical protein D3C87_1277890 [compost metagenome]